MSSKTSNDWKFAAALFLVVSACAALADTALMLGHVGPTSARVWVYSDEPAATAAVFRQDDLAVSGRVLRVDEQIAVVDAEGLRAGEETRVEFGGASAAFRTAAPPAVTGRLVVAFGSCDRLHDPKQHTDLFRQMVAARPDLVLWLGDNWYYVTPDGQGTSAQSKESKELIRGDWSDPVAARARALRTRLHPDLRELLAAAPQYATWDDHDFGYNNAPYGDPPDLTAEQQAEVWMGREAALRVFTSMWANPSYGLPDQPGTFFSFRRGPAVFFMMDDRYAKDVPAHQIWGSAQVAWLKRGLLEAERDGVPVKIIGTGSQILAPGKAESHEAEARGERDEVLAWIAQHHIGGVIYLTGDRHRSELWYLESAEDGAGAIECTASPFFHDYLREPGPAHEARRWVGPKAYGFGLLTIGADATEADLRFEARGEDGKVLPDVTRTSDACASDFLLRAGRFSPR